MKKMRVTVNGVCYDVEVELLEDDDVAGSSYGHAATTHKPSLAHAAPRPAAGAGVLESPVAGTVVEVKVKPGSKVREHEPIVVIEAMKMNTTVSSPADGTVADLLVKAGDQVVQGQPLVRFR